MKESFTTKVKREIEKHVAKTDRADLSKTSYDKVEVKKDLRIKFLKHGALCDPNTGYHFEYRFNTLDDANDTLKELSMQGILGKISVSRDEKRKLVYITDALSILQLLKLLGATKSLKEFAEVYDYKNTVKDINRKVNFETANIKKSATKSLEQLEDIKKLLKIKKFEDLDNDLKIVIKARKKYPMLSLTELSRKIGNISKSTLNHRLMKIRKLIGE